MMTELDVFSTGLSTGLFVYLSAAFLFADAMLALWLMRHPRPARLALHAN